MPIRIELDEKFFPVQTFFNAIPEKSFWGIIYDLLNGVGYEVDVCVCEFLDDTAQGEIKNGVRFSIYEDSIVVSDEEFHFFLEGVCSVQAGKSEIDMEEFKRLFPVKH